MLNLKGILFILLGLYLVGLVFVLQNGRLMRELPAEAQDYELSDMLIEELSSDGDLSNPFPGTTYYFNDPKLAYKVLTQFENRLYKPLDAPTLLSLKLDAHFDEFIYGFKPEDDYCDRHRAYFVEYPESVFQEINVLLGRANDSFVTVNAINGFANDMHPQNHNGMPNFLKNKGTTPIKTYTNVFFTTPHMYDKLQFGKHYSCLSQISNHIPGSAHLSRKDLVAESATEYLKNYTNRPQCINYDKFFPQTFRLKVKSECLEFFDRFNSEEYVRLKQERRIVYMKKITGLHKGEGVQPLTPTEEVILREQYKNGSECGKIRDNILMQHYVHNPLLLNGHKFDFRMYMLVASTDPLMVYYHDGNLRVSLGNYTADTDDKKTLLTNIALNKQIYDSAREGELFEGMTLEQLAYAQQWSMERLQEYLLQNNIIDDPNWLDNYLRPEFKKAMVHLTRMSFKNYLKTSKIYELYGVDFMLDENLNLWFIEANSGPAIKGLPDYLVKYVVDMLHDHFKIEFGLFRSRVKRVINYINELMGEEGAVVENKDGDVTINNFEERFEKFEKINRNGFESEFMISPNNTFSLIVDESLEGVDRYMGWISEDCL